MTMTVTHAVPDGSLPQSAMQEEISKAYVHMVASAAGLTLLDWKTDYAGIDVTVKSLVDYQCVGGYQPQFDLQLKCTYQDNNSAAGDTFSWSVDGPTHRKVTHPNRSVPATFAVMVIPEEPGVWLSHNKEGVLARSHMYWLRGSDFPELPAGQKSKTLTLPKTNLMTASAMLMLMKEASERFAA
ncbi:DUF4365 domain-containing protein [Arthrobacter cheniae]|nr:DUF4365 domain-containing protein [Arthrobacter cheniae]